MIDAGDVSDVVDVVGDIVDRDHGCWRSDDAPLLLAEPRGEGGGNEVGDERNHADAAVGRERGKDVIRHIARHVDEGART